jgi:hypothetical protein
VIVSEAGTAAGCAISPEDASQIGKTIVFGAQSRLPLLECGFLPIVLLPARASIRRQMSETQAPDESSTKLAFGNQEK